MKTKSPPSREDAIILARAMIRALNACSQKGWIELNRISRSKGKSPVTDEEWWAIRSAAIRIAELTGRYGGM